MNREWSVVASNWLGSSVLQGSTVGTIGFGMTVNQLQMSGRAPESLHIVWTKPMTFGGLVDEGLGDLPFYEGFTYESKFDPPVIIGGILYYYNEFPSGYKKRGVYAVDLRTGDCFGTKIPCEYLSDRFTIMIRLISMEL